MTKCESRVCYWQKGGLCRAPHQDTYDTGSCWLRNKPKTENENTQEDNNG